MRKKTAESLSRAFQSFVLAIVCHVRLRDVHTMAGMADLDPWLASLSAELHGRLQDETWIKG